MSYFALLLKDRRGQKSLDDLAIELDMSKQTLWRAECGREVSLKVFVWLCKYLSISMDCGHALMNDKMEDSK